MLSCRKTIQAGFLAVPTIITHAALPLTLGLGLGRQAIPRGLLLAGIALAVLPDLDVIAFRLGIPYAIVF
jgi:inner membrane protein